MLKSVQDRSHHGNYTNYGFSVHHTNPVFQGNVGAITTGTHALTTPLKKKPISVGHNNSQEPTIISQPVSNL